MENSKMNDLMLKMYISAKSMIEREEGQDLVEYALVVALIAFGAITGMGFLAKGINNAFSGIATTLTTNV
jgi:pilus assembly protein Flp/PilA